MARDLNKVMLIGRLGTEPEMRYTANGKAVTNFRIAVNRLRRANDTGENRDETDWFTVNAWERLAETCSQYLAKGSRIYIEGRLQTRSYETQDGQKRFITEVVASDMIMLDTRRSGERSEGGDSRDGGESGESRGMEDVNVDDIPF